MTQPKIGILILNWNGLNDTVNCLASLKNQNYSNYKILVVDNGSDQPEHEILKQKFGDFVEVIRNEKNLGYAGGNNVGINELLKDDSIKYIWILNNDTIINPDCLNELIQNMNDEKTGIAGPSIYHLDNTIQSLGGKINLYTGKFTDIKEGPQNPFEVDYIIGCSILIKTNLLKKLKGFNQKYFSYTEDVELCIRAKKLGFKILSVPKAKIQHKEYASSKKSSKIDYYLTRNKLWLIKEHANLFQKFIF
ncbi:MAG: glycosyltransferase family 2 protein, partial [Patescibacteria group bacterium]